MRTLILPVFAATALASPGIADTSPAELFAMSNSSAAETILRETSMGDITAARIRLALGNMSAAEREAFFAADQIERVRVLRDAEMFGDSNGPAEMAAELRSLQEAK